MKSRIVTGVILSLVALLVAVSTTSTAAKNESSCISCHTDDAALKRLCKVPDIPTGEAQG